MTILDKLDDDTWAELHHYISELGRCIESRIGRKPSTQEFFEILSWAFSNSNIDIFNDIGPSGIESIKVKPHKVPVKIERGAIIGVPIKDQGWHPIIYITSNRFGDAFGVFKCSLPMPILPDNWSPEVLEAVYSSLYAVRTKRWRILGHRPDLLKMFSPVPEIYHRKDFILNRENPEVGEFGAAESPEGKLRSISRAEAEGIGLLDGRYRPVMLEDDLASYLEAIT